MRVKEKESLRAISIDNALSNSLALQKLQQEGSPEHKKVYANDGSSQIKQFSKLNRDAAYEIRVQSELNKQRSEAILKRHRDTIEQKRQLKLEQIAAKDNKMAKLRKSEEQAQKQISKIRF